MHAGKSAPDALRALLNGDAACQVRQVGMIDAKGDVATFTGSRDIVAAGGSAGTQTAPTDVQCGTGGARELLAGNIPSFLRRVSRIEVSAADSDGVMQAVQFEVMPVYLAIASDKDFVRMPMRKVESNRVR